MGAGVQTVRRRRSAGALVLLLLAGCGGGDKSPVESGAGAASSTQATTTTPPTTAPATMDPTTSRGSTTSPARQGATATTAQERAGPRAGARAYVELYLGGGPVRPCAGVLTGAPHVTVRNQWQGAQQGPELGTNATICFYEFAADRPLDATVTLPGGAVRTFHTAKPGGQDGGYWVWSALPGDPLGTYSVVAAQGSARATTDFTVVAPSGARLTVVDPHLGPSRPGAAFTIILAGFTPNATVPVDYYQPDPKDNSGPGMVPVRSFTVQVDGRGRATSTFTTAATDKTGCLVFAGAPDGDTQCTYSHFHLA